MKNALLIIGLLVLSSSFLGCSKSPEAQAKSCMNALLSADVAEIKKSFIPEMAELLSNMELSNLDKVAKQNREIVSIKELEEDGGSEFKHAFLIEHKAKDNQKVNQDRMYLIEQDGALFCAIRK